MSPELEKIVARVKKMLALAANNPNPHEAASAASMAEKLMRKYQLDNATIMQADFRNKDNFATADVSGAMKRNVGHRPSKLPIWVGWLAVPCAQLYDCGARNVRVYYVENGAQHHEAMIRFYGFAPDVECAVFCFEYLMNTMIASLRAYQVGGLRSKKESEDYRRGYVMALISSLHAAIEEKKRAMEADSPDASRSTALVVVKMTAVQEKYGDFGYRTTKNTTRVSDQYLKGMADGSRVNVRQRGVSGSADTGSDGCAQRKRIGGMA